MGFSESMLIGFVTAIVVNVFFAITQRRFCRKPPVVSAELARNCIALAEETQQISRVVFEAYEEAKRELEKYEQK